LGFSPAEKSPDTSKKQEAMPCVIRAAAPHQITDRLDSTSTRSLKRMQSLFCW